MAGDEKRTLADFQGGWIVGNFSPALIQNTDIEIGVKFFLKGEIEPEHYQLESEEINLVVSGSCRLNGHILTKGDILRVPPRVSGDFEALSDMTMVVIKSPSLPKDKRLGRYEK